MSHKKFQAELDKIRVRTAKKLQIRINAACDKTGWEFSCGMGMWDFEKDGKTLDGHYNTSGPAILKRLVNTLIEYDSVDEYFVSNYCEPYQPLPKQK